MSVELRSVRRSEYPKAIELWYRVFPEVPPFFERYFEGDPWYQEGDCLGAWVDGRLASLIHVCRRPLEFENRQLLLGGISNVATDAAFRGLGLSSRLMEVAVDHMTRERFDFGLLGTGINAFYERLGWLTVPIPYVVASVNVEEDSVDETWERSEFEGRFLDLYNRNRRTLRLTRTPEYVDGWRLPHRGQAFVTDNAAVVFALDTDKSDMLTVKEWHAPDTLAEAAAFKFIAAEAVRRGLSTVKLERLPEKASLDAQDALLPQEYGMWNSYMFRNISLSDAQFDDIVALYGSSKAAWWPIDGF